MAQHLQRQITHRLKQKPCPQKDCRNNNQDNIQLIVFGQPNTKRSGFMCSECIIDTQLLAQLAPVEKHSISIKKFMKTLTAKYKQYAEQKNSVNWGPNMLENEKLQIKQLLTTYQQTLFSGTLEIVNFVKDLETKTIQQIKSIHKSLSFEKLSLLLSEEDDEEQQRMNVANELKKVTSNIMELEGQYKMADQKEMRDKGEEVLVRWRNSLKQAKLCFQKLIDVQRNVLKQLAPTVTVAHEEKF